MASARKIRVLFTHDLGAALSLEEQVLQAWREGSEVPRRRIPPPPPARCLSTPQHAGASLLAPLAQRRALLVEPLAGGQAWLPRVSKVDLRDNLPVSSMEFSTVVYMHDSEAVRTSQPWVVEVCPRQNQPVLALTKRLGQGVVRGVREIVVRMDDCNGRVPLELLQEGSHIGF